jgi:hypothetical protein
MMKKITMLSYGQEQFLHLKILIIISKSLIDCICGFGDLEEK